MFEDFNSEISESINYSINGEENILELGYKEWNIIEEFEFTQSSFSVFEVGASWTPPINLPNLLSNRLQNSPLLRVNLVYKGTSESWFENSSNQISEDINEINSFSSFSDNITINGRLGIGFSLIVKL